MNGHKEENLSTCNFHPKEAVLGVCALCLNQRLLVLVSGQKKHNSSSAANLKAQDFTQKKAPINNFLKFFSFSSYLLNRFEFRRSRFDHPVDDHDSFISMEFEENGSASWDKEKVSKVSLENCRMVSRNHQIMTKELPNNKRTIKHPTPWSALRWQKRIGHILKRSSPCHVSSKVDG